MRIAGPVNTPIQKFACMTSKCCSINCSFPPHLPRQDLVPGQPPAGPGPAPLLTLSPAQLAALAAHPAASRAPVLWLRGPVAVPQLPSPDHAKLYGRMAAMCCALSDTLPPSRECMDRPPGAQVAPA